MNFRLGSLFRRNANSPLRRLYFFWLKHVTGVFYKRQKVHFLSINGKRFKRLELGDSCEARELEQALMSVSDPDLFPPLIHRHENQLLFEFVEGRPFDALRSDDQSALLQFFTMLYRSDINMQASRPYLQRLLTDLNFLVDAGLIDVRLHRMLSDRAHEVQPQALVCGYDYIDPVAKNFVITDGALCAIDVESLRSGIALGTGIAKAALHWLEEEQKHKLLSALDPQGNAHFLNQFDFVELMFRIGWTKRKLLQGKHHAIDISLLEALLAANRQR